MQGAKYFCIKEENQKEKGTPNTAQKCKPSHTRNTPGRMGACEKNSATKSGLVDDGLICPCLQCKPSICPSKNLDPE